MRLTSNNPERNKLKLNVGLTLLGCLLFLVSCNATGISADDEELKNKKPKTEHVILVVVDGPRYTETWGDEKLTHMPKAAKYLLPQAALFTNFYNEGPTWTSPGHTAITTGVYQEMDNNGLEIPQNPSIFQLYLEKSALAPEKVWIVASKGKLNVLANSKHPAYKDKYVASWDCGTDGVGNGYRVDSLTYKKVTKALTQHQPSLMLVNFREPDLSGHQGNWEGYLKGIESSDLYVWQLWNLIQSDPHYANKTALLVTNDHGRHLDGRHDNFVSHGDDCEGCRHISLLALGPDFKKGVKISNRYNQTDITATVAKMLGFDLPNGNGRVIEELFN